MSKYQFHKRVLIRPNHITVVSLQDERAVVEERLLAELNTQADRIAELEAENLRLREFAEYAKTLAQAHIGDMEQEPLIGDFHISTMYRRIDEPDYDPVTELTKKLENGDTSDQTGEPVDGSESARYEIHKSFQGYFVYDTHKKRWLISVHSAVWTTQASNATFYKQVEAQRIANYLNAQDKS